MSSSYYYDSGALAFLGVFVFLGFLIAIAGYVIVSLFLMKIFDKAGVQGKWRAWVPIYNYMVFAKLGDVSPWVVLIAAGLSFIPYLNFLTGIALAVVLAIAAWRIGLKLQKDAVWVVLWVLLGVVWLGINAFDKSRWNPNIVPAPWASNSFFADTTVWAGIPVQSTNVPPAAAYGAPGYGQAPQGYAPQPGFGQSTQPGYPQPGFGQPVQPGYTPPAAAPAAPPVTPPPAAPAVPPVTPPPAAPPAPPAPPAAPTDPTQPPA